MKISVREFKDHLSKYLHSMHLGESIVVTSHGIPLAMDNPHSTHKA